jgi:hypothetical protein
MGCLEELHTLSSVEVNEVIRDIQQEFDLSILSDDESDEFKPATA